MFPLVLSLALYLRAIRTGSPLASAGCALSLGYTVRQHPRTIHCRSRLRCNRFNTPDSLCLLCSTQHRRHAELDG